MTAAAESFVVTEPGLTVYPHMEQRSPEWFAARCGIVTASAVGTFVTPSTLKVASNDKTRGLIATLVSERIAGEVEESWVSADMQRGIEHEPIARDRYAEVNGVTVDEVGFMVKTVGGHKLGYSPDGLVGDDGLIEVKCPRAKGHVQTILADQVPAHYMAQCQAGLLVSGRKWIDFVSFCAGLPLWTKRVTPDPKWQAAITEAVAMFEKTAEQMVNDYLTRADGLPKTKPIPKELIF
jgi:hypothetical protein